MQIPILIEPVAGNGFRSRGGEPFALSAEDATREEVLAKLQAQLQARLQGGAQVATLEVAPSAGGNLWVEFAGTFKGDPHFDAWQETIAENRRRADAGPDVP